MQDHYMVIKIKDMLDSIAKVVIEWIPSHIGIHRNENADKLAKKSLNQDITSKIPYAKKEIRSKVNGYYYEKWKSGLTSNPNALEIINNTQSTQKVVK